MGGFSTRIVWLFTFSLCIASPAALKIAPGCQDAIGRIAGLRINQLSVKKMTPDELMTNAMAMSGKNPSIREGEKTREWWTPDHQHIAQEILFRWEEVTVDDIKRDLVEKGFATIVENRGRDFSIRLKDGPEIKFTVQDGQLMEMWSYSTVAQYEKGETSQVKFYELLSDQGLLGKYFRKNPYLIEEREALKKVASGKKPVKPELQDQKKIGDFKGSKNGILLFPDRHGDKRRVQELKALLESDAVDWVGLEMLPHTLQPVIDRFLNSPVDSADFRTARDLILRFYGEETDGNAWRSYWKDHTAYPVKPDQVPYMEILYRAKALGKKVIGLNGENYRSQHYTDNKTLFTRNLIWVNQIPSDGKGVIFGGAHHFSLKGGANVQDFLPKTRPVFLYQQPDFHFDF